MDYIICALPLLMIAGVYWIQVKFFRIKKLELANKQLCIDNQDDYLRFTNHYFLDSLYKHEAETSLLMADLHDSLGSTITALRLNFDNFRMQSGAANVIDGSYKKIEVLLNEAYQKVVSLSTPIYIGSVDLALMDDLKAIAARASGLSGSEISVVSFGLTSCISYYRQLTIVYIIQQVLFNVLGYAFFKGIKISITQNSSHIYIVLEIDSAGTENDRALVYSDLKFKIESMGNYTVALAASNTIQINIPL